MIKPNDLKNIEIENTNFEELETKIDNGIKSSHGLYPWETAIIEGEYSLESRNMIARKYKENGWNFVYHQTSSENGERAGLTCFMLSTKELDNKYTKNYHKV